MKLGIFSNTIGGSSPEEVAERSRSLGVEAVQLRLGWPGLDLLGSAADRRRVRQAYEQAGVQVAALAAYTNLMDPDGERRQANRDWLENAVRAARELGTQVVVTEAGSYHPDDSWSDHPHNHTARAWADLCDITASLCRLCMGEGAILAYEPYVHTLLASAPAARRLAQEIASPALGFVLDTAGLVTMETLPRNAEVTREALAALTGRIALAHADDVRYEHGQARWLPLGWGDLDAEAFLQGLVTAGYTGTLIVEHLPEAQVPEALAFCRGGLMAGAGSPERNRRHGARVEP